MNFFSVTQVKACRKKCQCYWCFEKIIIGQPKTKTALVWDGDFHSDNFHPECFEALRTWQRLPENVDEYEWPEQGEMKRGSVEPK